MKRLLPFLLLAQLLPRQSVLVGSAFKCRRRLWARRCSAPRRWVAGLKRMRGTCSRLRVVRVNFDFAAVGKLNRDWHYWIGFPLASIRIRLGAGGCPPAAARCCGFTERLRLNSLRPAARKRPLPRYVYCRPLGAT